MSRVVIRSTAPAMAPNSVADTWESGDPYELYVGRWSRRVAPLFLEWLRVPAGRRWLDVGCGTGALSAAIVDRCSPSSVTAVEPSAGFREQAGRQLAGRVQVHSGTAAEIPLPDGCIDATVSGLVLNFVADECAALTEMARVSVRGGTIGAYVWDYAGKMQMMRVFWDSAVELDAAAAVLDEGARFPSCTPPGLTDLFTRAGLQGVQVTAIDIAMHFASFDEFWRPFLGGQGPAPAYAMALDDAARTRLRDRIRDRLPRRADGSLSLAARAWAVRATVAD